MRLPSLSSTSFKQAALSAALAASVAFTPGASLAAQLIDPSLPVSALQAQERTVENLFSQATPSVVFITTFVEKTDRLTMNAIEVPAGTGSGFLWDKDGNVVTNYHVIRGAQAAKVLVTDASTGRVSKYSAKLVGFNPDKDVAVLKIDSPKQLVPITLGNSAPLKVGQTTLAIGNPFGLDHSLSVGVISGLGREVQSPSGRPITNVIQTDAAINPGNSGGALLDSSGRLIGMNTAIFSPSGASAGIGFAIPVDTLKYQVETIIKDGRVARPAIGISYVSAAQARALGVGRGVLVLDVPKGSSAAKAGLMGSYRADDGGVVLGDVIIGVNDDKVDTDLDLFRAIDKFAPGDKISVVISRLVDLGGGVPGAEELRLKIELQESKSVNGDLPLDRNWGVKA